MGVRFSQPVPKSLKMKGRKTMKYYSEILEKLFDSIDELQAAEATEATKEETIAKLKAEVAEHWEAIKEHREAISKINSELEKLGAYTNPIKTYEFTAKPIFDIFKNF